MIPIARPEIGAEEISGVVSVLQSGMLAQGSQVREFEEQFAEYVGARHAIAVANGTCALHIANLAHGVGPGDEVITTPFSFMATASSALVCGATVSFVDVSHESFNIDIDEVRRAITPETKAIIPVHLFGNPVDMDRLMDIAESAGVSVVQDAAQAHGATVRGRRLGEYSTTCYSFYPTKNMTTGEGGMITTNDDVVATRCRLLRQHGMSTRYIHEMIGYNYRMTEISAAIGLAQLPRLDGMNQRRRDNASLLSALLTGIPGIVCPREEPGLTHVYHQYTIRVLPEYGMTRDELMQSLAENGIGSMIYYPLPLHRQEAMKAARHVVHNVSVADQLANEVLSIPVHPSVSLEEIRYIAETINCLSKRSKNARTP